ncbi:Aquaporin SIP1.1 [Rhynchospora pubera]|uniref:Aquaporin SIP1.1 n=1 Tax=Rhynchospora pubera TaxID=906938 RepID=A0AAV8CDW8_9POAL|nr:Aquaporin SIP1.1 [Rhynchospora pubera]
MGIVKAVVGDAVVTFLWVLSVSTLGPTTVKVMSNLPPEAQVPAAQLGVSFVILATLLFTFTALCEAVGGASFNPTGLAAFYAAGLGNDGLFSMALRFPAQAAGAVGGALAIKELMPEEYKHMLGGPSLKVDLHTGALAEGVLTFVITLAVLWAVVKGPRNPLLKILIISTSTLALVIAGGAYTGPSMNPANAFGWAYVNDRHNTWEQFYVYWICPFVGAVLAASVFRVLFPTPSATNKVKKA